MTSVVGAYDPRYPLIIDPGLDYSTFLGGTGQDTGSSENIAVDTSGRAYVVGSTFSADYPTTPGAFDRTYNGSGEPDAFVTKLNASGSELAYSTFLGGTNDDRGFAIAVLDRRAYVTGETVCCSADFPTTPGAFDTTFDGFSDIFVTKLNATGSALVYSTFLGGFTFDESNDIAVDGRGRAYVTGWTQGTQGQDADFPTTPGAFDRTFDGDSDAFVTKLNASGSALVYSTFLGGCMMMSVAAARCERAELT